MKWIDDPPADWSTASDDPPSGPTADVSLETEKTDNGIVVREPGSDEAYLHAIDGAILLEDYS